MKRGQATRAPFAHSGPARLNNISGCPRCAPTRSRPSPPHTLPTRQRRLHGSLGRPGQRVEQLLAPRVAKPAHHGIGHQRAQHNSGADDEDGARDDAAVEGLEID